jgi:hypothetical protein
MKKTLRRWGRRCHFGPTRDAGMVTVETAVAIPLLLAIAGVTLWGLGAGAAAIEVSEVGRTAARELARGVSEDQVIEHIRLAIPEAHTDIRSSGGGVIVTVHRMFTVPLPLLAAVGLDLSSTYVVPLEWATSAAG